MKVSQGYLSLEANEAPLVQIFQEIGKQAGIMVEEGHQAQVYTFDKIACSSCGNGGDPTARAF